MLHGQLVMLLQCFRAREAVGLLVEGMAKMQQMRIFGDECSKWSSNALVRFVLRQTWPKMVSEIQNVDKRSLPGEWHILP